MALTPRKKAKLKLQARFSPFARGVMLPAGEYIRIKEIAGLPLILAAVAALIWANSPWQASYEAIWSSEEEIRFLWFARTESLREWINDALLPLFFFVAGLEIKREMVRGELSTLRGAALPVVLAIGGFVVPAGVYLLINSGEGGVPNGWGIPVATDVAFALAVLALFGSRIPTELKILVLTFAAVDDVFGVLVIALFYTGDLDTDALLGAGGLFSLILVLRILYIPLYSVFTAVSVALWYAVLDSGIHPTVMGVALGLLAPAKPLLDQDEFREASIEAARRFREVHRERKELLSKADPSEEEQQRLVELAEQEDGVVGQLEEQARQTEPITDWLIHTLNPWVSYAILPLFALANAGVGINLERLGAVFTTPAPLGILIALVIGKPLGLMGFAWVAIKFRLARLPDALTWNHLLTASLLAGIGFTVSLFIADLAFSRSGSGDVAAARLAIFIASVTAGVLGFLWLAWRRRKG